MKLPDLDELLFLRGAARSLNLRAHGPARALLLGSHRSGHRGRGLEFEEVRPYVAGDDPRSIDWRVTARRGRPHTKLFREERERPVWLLVDLHPGMFFGSRVQLKSMAAVRATALLAWVAALGGDRVGAVIDNAAATRILPPRSREAGVLPVLNTLLELQPRAPARRSVTPPSSEEDGAPFSRGAGEGRRLAFGQTSLNHLSQELAPLVHPGSLVLALSDFAGVDQGSEVLWSGLVAHSECRWFWISDILERSGLPDGRFRGGWPDRILTMDGAGVRSAWQAAWRERTQRIESIAQRLRISLTQLDTGVEVERALEELLKAPSNSLAGAVLAGEVFSVPR